MESKKAVEKLQREFNENINSHVFLLETNDLESCLKDVKDLSKKILCNNDKITESQIDDETYLELIIIKPEGKDIKKDQVLLLQERLKTKPVIGDYLIYIIIPAETLSDISANKLLKTIEEPNQHVLGFLITNNSDQLLSTIKSRCEIINLMYDVQNSKKEIDPEVLEVAKKLVEAIEEKDHIKYTQAKSNDKIIKENSKILENLIKDYYNTACNLNKNDILDQQLLEKIKNGNSFQALIKKTKYINKTLNKLTRNMNTDLLLEKLFLELKDVK